MRSAVRSYLLPNGPHPAYTGIIGIGGFTPLSALPAIPQADIEALTYTFGPRGFFGYGGADNGTMMWWSNLWRKREFSHEELANLDQRAIQDELLHRYPRLPRADRVARHAYRVCAAHEHLRHPLAADLA